MPLKFDYYFPNAHLRLDEYSWVLLGGERAAAVAAAWAEATGEVPHGLAHGSKIRNVTTPRRPPVATLRRGPDGARRT